MAAIICSGIMLKKTKLFAGDPAPFVMELPAYHVPAWGNVLRATWERGWSFIKRAGSVILLATVVLWFMQGFGFENGAFGMVEDQDNSVLAAIGYQGRMDLCTSGLRQLACNRRFRLRPDCKGERGWHLRRAVPLRRRAF